MKTQEKQQYQPSSELQANLPEDLQEDFKEFQELMGKPTEENTREDEVELKAKQASYFETLAHAIKSAEGQAILTEIKSRLNDRNNELYSISMKNMSFPFEYSKEELNQMKCLRAQQEELKSMIAALDPEANMEVTKKLRQEIQLLKTGEPIEPIY